MDNENRTQPIRELVLNVFATNGCLVDSGNKLVREIGLTTAWWQVLGALGYAPAPLPVAHIARNMGLTRQAVQRVVELLAGRGFVTFAANPHHQRARLVVLTPAGRKALTAAESAAAAVDRIALDRIGAERVAIASAVLAELREVLAQVLDLPPDASLPEPTEKG
ncbi:MarR family winged helix-turn-helix transcriptional regulator [Pseudoduganella armeniaca]|uniref:MarR family transcriptional regulator n=1 Tax=Pseudoduganella armeniaca TaxID=2072590 RepID=A0A2R4CBW9_9BURK|nr:MarR family transcriptional regulator [Pseudoduganella armeniaca]AVR97134.1 MarR family transcriptional regulator [Pseudoduganella armeniaca]